ncbi:MAG: UDP-N-acetylmuramate dehydrogenase [Deltaproteobacteria bacterium]|nr:UDP-N-acetylmuramate dehydrogenase [Deltaproteobacteria bacterium]
MEQKTGLVKILNEAVIFNTSMSSYSTFRVGGNAEAICFISELPLLTQVVSFLHSEEIPWMTIGKGSNLLITDKGINGAVIILRGKLAEVFEGNGQTVTAGGGISIVRLLKYCVQNELSGMEFMSGIPGTLGGAVIMNAGACGQEIGARLKKIGIVNREGKKEEIDRSQISFEYRRSNMPESAIVYSVTLGLEKGEGDSIRERIRINLDKRKKSQPLNMPSAGSVFKNPPGKFAGKLIEESGLKGKRIGGAMISPGHANFIVNAGNARASDIIELIDYTRKKVKEDSGIDLETEIKVVGL